MKEGDVRASRIVVPRSSFHLHPSSSAMTKHQIFQLTQFARGAG